MSLSPIPYIRWAKEHAAEGEFPLTMSAVPPVDWDDLDLDPRSLALSEFTAYGDLSVREGIGAEWGWGAERVFLGSSATHTHFCFAASLLEPGDRVLYEQPGYLPLLDALSLLQVEAVPFERRFEDAYAIPRESLQAAATDPRTKLILLTDLHNPSGVALTEDDRAFLGTLCEDSGVEVIVDEMYRTFLDPDPGPACRFHDKIVTVGGFNKVMGLSQIRIGWGIATPDRIERARRILDATTIHNSCLTDQVARAAWPVRDRLLSRARSIAAAGWSVLGPWLERSPLECVTPSGGLVCFPKVPESFAAGTGSDAAGDAFQRAALARGVNVTPGRFFGAPGHVRLGCGLPPAELASALGRLEELVPA